jgi:PhnB protein
MTVQPIPEGFHTITPYLIVPDVDEQTNFLQRAFSAEVLFRMTQEDGTVNHAEVRIGDSRVMMGQAQAGFEPMPVMLYLYVEDVDAVYAQALAVGGESVRELANEFYGDRVGAVKDAAGNQWWIATHIEDVSPEEMARRQKNR